MKASWRNQVYPKARLLTTFLAFLTWLRERETWKDTSKTTYLSLHIHNDDCVRSVANNKVFWVFRQENDTVHSNVCPSSAAKRFEGVWALCRLHIPNLVWKINVKPISFKKLNKNELIRDTGFWFLLRLLRGNINSKNCSLKQIFKKSNYHIYFEVWTPWTISLQLNWKWISMIQIQPGSLSLSIFPDGWDWTCFLVLASTCEYMCSLCTRNLPYTRQTWKSLKKQSLTDISGRDIPAYSCFRLNIRLF